MDANNVPKVVRDKLLAMEAAVEHLGEKVARTKEAINNARTRLTGKFNNDQEYQDVYSTLKRLVKDLPIIEEKRDAAARTAEECQSWLDSLPDDTTLEVVKAKPNGADLASLKEHIRHAEDELQTLDRVPVPSSNIELHVRDYVASFGRPKVTGVEGSRLQVTWPSEDAISLCALLMPDKMTEVILKGVNRAANDPLPLPQRKQRIAELRRTIDDLQRAALSLGGDSYSLPEQVILGVRVVRREQVKKIERRVAAAVK
jgi:hypothetical protein